MVNKFQLLVIPIVFLPHSADEVGACFDFSPWVLQAAEKFFLVYMLSIYVNSKKSSGLYNKNTTIINDTI